MKIMKQTVKTIVNIALDSADFANLIEKYKRSDAHKASFPNAFKDMSVTAEMPEENVIRVMKEIFSRGNADTYNFIAKALASRMDLSETYIRRKINEARSFGIPICSTRHGYYFSEDPSEIELTISSLKRRISTQIAAIIGLSELLEGGSK